MNSCAGADSNRRYTEVERQLPVQVSRLADQGNTVSVPGLARHMGCPSHLLFEPAVGGIASGVGVILCCIRDMAALAVTPAACFCNLHCAVSQRGRVVDNYSSLARSRVATGSGGNAAGGHRLRTLWRYGHPDIPI